MARKKNNKTYFLIITIVVLLTIMLTSVITYSILKNKFIQGKKEIPMDILVGKDIGFDLGTDKFHFGMVPPGESARRNLTITNNYNKNILFKVSTNGTMGNWVVPSDKIFKLEKDENKSIELKIRVPQNTSFKNYTGTIIVDFVEI